MVPIPASRSALVAGPLLGAGIGVLAGGLFLPMAGPVGAATLAVVVGTLMVLAMGWMACCSRYGSRHGSLAALLLMFMLALLVAGACSALVVMLGWPTLASWILYTVALSAAVSFFAGAWRERRALHAAGLQGAWASEHIDLARWRVRASAAAGRSPAQGGGFALTQIWLGVAIVNLPLLVRSWGIADSQWLPAVLAMLLAALVWACLSVLGPMAGRALFLIDHERRTGRRFVHEDIEALQAMRAR